jgi:hypothetical protein
MAVMLVSVLAFVVSVIVELTKNLPGLSKIPTDIEVVVLSVVITVAALFAYASYSSLVVLWYMVVGAVLCGFFVAFVAMFGWEKLTTLWGRFKK